MAQFNVTATTKEGDSYDEILDAPDRFTVYRDIRARGDRVTRVKEVGKRSLFSLRALNEAFQGVSTDEKVILVRNLAAMLEAGLTSSRALAVMERQTPNVRLRSIIGSLIGEVRSGSTLSAGFAKFPTVFSPLMVSMSHAGEESGKLADSLRSVANQMARASALKKKIRGALMYPTIVLLAMAGIAVLMLIYVVPTLTATFAELGADLPPTTKFVIGASTFLATHTILSLLGMVIVVAAFIAALRTPQGRRAVDYLMLKIPLFHNLVMETNSARTARTLSSLLSAGVDMVLAISIARDVVGNSFYQKVLKEAEESVTKGGTISATFEKFPKLYPPLMAEMIAVGEETGRLSDLLSETAEFYETSVENQTKDLSTIIEPLLMLFIGAGVGFFAVSMIAPIYSLSNAI